MNAMQIAESEALSALRISARPAQLEGSSICITPRIEAALTALLQALEYAHDLDRSTWEFAVDMASLRSLKLSKSDLRWLVGKGLVETAIEVTMAGDAERSFRKPPAPLFCKKACFILTTAGAKLARELSGRVDVGATNTGLSTIQPPMPKVSPVPEPLVPSWDRDRQKLTVGSIVVKHFKVPAANQEAILAAFQEESWPPRIDDPLPPHREQPPKRRLQETIKSLNRNQKRSLIRFAGDGSGQGVCWEFCGEMDHQFRAATELP